uniref:transcription antitermination factor NusB n=1 Tax=Anaerococcus mediterraneensis TaxID=1870984 RepID=UPI0009316FFA|nr:transcription antitermination factor NusB [Anaerococcus mediterraneensis]
MNRVEQREWVLKLIYQDTINKIDDTISLFENHNIDQKETFIIDSINSYKKNYDQIEKKLEENLLDKHTIISKMVRSILYLSINEIYFMDIPVSVSINEAVNLSKKFSDTDDYKLVNLILGNIVRKDNK